MSHFTVLAHLPVSKEEYDEGYLYEVLEPYSECTENRAYLDFQDKTEEVKEGWNTTTVKAIRMPDNSCVYAENRALPKGYVISDDKIVYEKSGRVTEVCKRYIIIPECPVNLVYNSLDDFAEGYYGYEKRGARYGYWCNNNAFYDWFSVGGRWSGAFLMKDGTWVDIADKKDIQWDEMKRHSRESAMTTFAELEKIFKTKQVPEDAPLVVVKEDGVYSWGSCLYKAGETLDEYFKRKGCDDNTKWATGAYGIFDKTNGYRSRGEMGWFGISSGEMSETDWNQIVEKFIDDIPDDEVLIMLDCHI